MAMTEMGGDGVTVITVQQYNDIYDLIGGVTAGAVTASKALIPDANKDLGDLRNLDVTNLDAGASGTAGSVDIFPTTASKGKLAITCADQTGDTTVSVTTAAMAAARTLTIPDPGTDASFVMTAGAQTLAGVKTFSSAPAVPAAGITLDAATLTAVELAQRALTVDMTDISAANSVFVVSPYAGNITKIYSVISGAITVGDAAITSEINGTLVTDGGMTIAYSGSAAGDVDIATPTATNTVAVGDVIEIISDGGSTDVSRATFTIVIQLT